jgi:ATP-dependent Clp protease ATP-binding subunit ClpA
MVAELRELQGETPMVPVQVDGHVVAEIVAGWTGIPLGKMVKDEIKTVLRLKEPGAARARPAARHRSRGAARAHLARQSG